MPTAPTYTCTDGTVITIDEAQRSRRRKASYTAPSDTLIYFLIGSDNDDDIMAALLATAPTSAPTDSNLYLIDATIEPIDNTDGIWLGTVQYAWPAILDVGQTRYSFNTAGGTQHITQSISTANSYAASGSAPSMQGAINVSVNDVQGVEAVVPTFEFEETWVFAASTVTEAYQGVIYSLTGKVCNAAFKGGNEGEILFLGAGGGQRPDTKYEITFKFAGSPNQTGLTIGGITGIAKKGWQYLWVYYQAKSLGSGLPTVQQPLYAYVEVIYPEADLSQLGIGT